MAPQPVKVRISTMQELVVIASQEAKLLGSDDVYLKLTPGQARAIGESLSKYSRPYRDNKNEMVPTLRFITLDPEGTT